MYKDIAHVIENKLAARVVEQVESRAPFYCSFLTSASFIVIADFRDTKGLGV